MRLFETETLRNGVKDGIRNSGSKVRAVVDARMGNKSINIALHNTPEIRALLLQWIAEAETESTSATLNITVLHTEESPRRLVLTIATAAHQTQEETA